METLSRSAEQRTYGIDGWPVAHEEPTQCAKQKLNVNTHTERPEKAPWPAHAENLNEDVEFSKFKFSGREAPWRAPDFQQAPSRQVIMR